jgi:hypothetical protein
MQMQELQLKAHEISIKEKKMAMDAAAKADQLEIEKQRIAAQKEIAGLQVGAKSAKDKADLESKERMEGMRIGAQAGQAKAQLDSQRRQEAARLTVDLHKHNTQQKKETKKAKE